MKTRSEWIFGILGGLFLAALRNTYVGFFVALGFCIFTRLFGN